MYTSFNIHQECDVQKVLTISVTVTNRIHIKQYRGLIFFGGYQYSFVIKIKFSTKCNFYYSTNSIDYSSRIKGIFESVILKKSQHLMPTNTNKTILKEKET